MRTRRVASGRARGPGRIVLAGVMPGRRTGLPVGFVRRGRRARRGVESPLPESQPRAGARGGARAGPNLPSGAPGTSGLSSAARSSVPTRSRGLPPAATTARPGGPAVGIAPGWLRSAPVRLGRGRRPARVGFVRRRSRASLGPAVRARNGLGRRCASGTASGMDAGSGSGTASGTASGTGTRAGADSGTSSGSDTGAVGAPARLAAALAILLRRGPRSSSPLDAASSCS